MSVGNTVYITGGGADSGIVGKLVAIVGDCGCVEAGRDQRWVPLRTIAVVVGNIWPLACNCVTCRRARRLRAM